MAQTAKKLHTSEKPADSAQLVAMKRTEDPVYAAHPEETGPTRSAIQQALQDGIEKVTCVVTDARQSVGHSFRVVRNRAAGAYSDLFYKSRYLARHLGGRAQQLKEERPLQLLAVIAGTAFIAGVFVRVWRSRRYEH